VRHVAITSLVTLPAQPLDARGWRVVVRIGTLVAAAFVSALLECGIDVDAPDVERAMAAVDA